MKLLNIAKLSLVLAATATCSFAATAAESANITVKGSLVPAACAISVDGSADFGNVKIGELKAQGPGQGLLSYQLIHQPINFTVNCTPAAKVALSAQADSQPASTPNFRIKSYAGESESTINSNLEELGTLGQVGEQDVGYYTATFSSAVVDGSTAEIMSSEDNGVSWTAVKSVQERILKLDGSQWYSWGKGTTPQAVTTVAGVINISAAVDPKVVDEAKDAIAFSTNTTLTLQYL